MTKFTLLNFVMPCGSSSCCSNSCSKKQQCCNSEDTKTPDAVSVESSDDGCGENCACCGFDRPEMSKSDINSCRLHRSVVDTETVVGAMKKLAGQAYLIYGEHTAWPKEANTMDDKLKVQSVAGTPARH